MTSASDEKWHPFNGYSVQGTGGSPTGPDSENMVGDQDIGDPDSPVYIGLQVPGVPGHCRSITRPPLWPSECLTIAPAEMNNTPRWQFGPLEDNQWGGWRLDPKTSWRELFQRIFTLGIFLGRGEPLCRHPFIVALSPGHSDITRFRPWSPIATGNHFDRAEKIPKIAFWHFGNLFVESFRIMSKSSWMMDPTRSREMPSCSFINLTEIRWSSKIRSWICSIISEVFTVLCRPGRGATQVENSPCLNWVSQFLTVAYDGACSPNVSLRKA